jgi:hypothetical protein
MFWFIFALFCCCFLWQSRHCHHLINMYCIPVIIVSLAHLGVNNLLLMQATLFYLWLGLWCLTPLSTIFQLWSVLLVEETGVPAENHRPASSHWQSLSLKVASNIPRYLRDIKSQFNWSYVLILLVVVNPTTIRSRPRWRPGKNIAWNRLHRWL